MYFNTVGSGKIYNKISFPESIDIWLRVDDLKLHIILHSQDTELLRYDFSEIILGGDVLSQRARSHR
jgi:hypothetical protein